MKRVPEANIYNIHGSIVPQLFQKIDDRFIYFDKINQHEGRFCILNDCKSEVLFEIGEGQVEISDRGEIFVFRYSDETTISLYSALGEVLWEISLTGIYFDIVRDNYGNYICLGNVDGKTVLKIINRMGIESGTINPSSLMFGSCIQVEGDDILLGGFDENNCFKVLKFNYIGNKSGEWQLDVDGNDRVISKILNHGNNLFLSISGKYDSLVILDSLSGGYSEINVNDLGLRYLLDFNLTEKEIYLLDGKNIYGYKLDDILAFSHGRHKRQSFKESSLVSYQYVMLSRGICDHMERLWGYVSTALITLAVTLLCRFNGILSEVFPTIMFLISLFWIIQYMTAIVVNTITFMDKSVRIDKLLTIYSKDYSSKNHKFPIYTALLAGSFSSLVSYNALSIIYFLISGIICFLILYSVEKRFVEKVKSQNSGVIIELLQPEDDKFREYIQSSIEKFRKGNCERICVDIVLQENLKENIIEKWAKSRRAIIREIDEATIQSNRITTVLDMSKRDIKYSRISIIMDYICFIKREVKIKEIEIALKDDKR